MSVADMLDFVDKVAIVTGGGHGMGVGIAKCFAEAGANVVITYKSHAEEAEQVVKMLKSFGGKVQSIHLDQSDVEQCRALADQVIEKLGRIDVLINNGGLHGATVSMKLDQATWDRIMSCNLRGTFFCAQSVAKYMIEQRSGVIISISSINAKVPLSGSTHYGASKAGLEMFTRCLAVDLGQYGIRVNGIAPGLINAPNMEKFIPGWKERFINRSPLKRAGEPEDIGNICLFLASPMSSWITGQTITADGGVTLASAY